MNIVLVVTSVTTIKNIMKDDFTKAKQITPQTKEKVWRRQHGRSLLSNKSITKEMCCCHVVGRGNSGVGYEWNIVGLTPDEHRELDESKPITIDGKVRWTNEEAQTLIRNHLILNYENWSESNCKYKKYKKEGEYGVVARRDRNSKAIR